MMQANYVSKGYGRDDVSRHMEAREGVCQRVTDLGGAWKHVEIHLRLTVVRGNA